jgi:adenylate cyclase
MRAMPDCQHIVDWLLGGAASQIGPDEVLSELCGRLEGAGVPLWRVAVFVTTLHPDLLGRRFLWQAGRGVATSEALHAVADSDEFRVSPFATVYSSRRPLRRCFAQGAPADDYPVLKELISEGVTDYVAVPLAFSDGTVHVATFATRAPDGFAEADIAALDAVMLPFARVAEIRALRRTAATLLGTYVGAQSGERILAGRIRLGDVEAIDAAIWLSDMRGFTALSEHVSAKELLGYLNRYFDC